MKLMFNLLLLDSSNIGCYC